MFPVPEQTNKNREAFSNDIDKKVNNLLTLVKNLSSITANAGIVSLPDASRISKLFFKA
jgi:hypothetical protein